MNDEFELFLYETEKKFKEALGKNVLGVEQGKHCLTIDIDNPNVLEKRGGESFGSISICESSKPNYYSQTGTAITSSVEGDLPVAGQPYNTEDKARVYDVVKKITDMDSCVVTGLHNHKHSIHTHFLCEQGWDDEVYVINELVDTIAEEFMEKKYAEA